MNVVRWEEGRFGTREKGPRRPPFMRRPPATTRPTTRRNPAHASSDFCPKRDLRCQLPPGDPGIYGARPGGVSPVPVSSPPRPPARPASAQHISSPPANSSLSPSHLIPYHTPPTPSPHKILAYPTAVQRRLSPLSPLSPEAHSLFHRSPSDTVARRSLRCVPLVSRPKPPRH